MFRRLTHTQLTVDLVVAGLFALVALPLSFHSSAGSYGASLLSIVPGLGAAAVVLTVFVFAGALALRRLSPAFALIAAWLGALAQMGVGLPPGFVDLAVFGVLFATAAYGSRRVFWLGLVSAVGGAVVATGYVVAAVLFGLDPRVWFVGLIIFGAVLFALVLSWTIGALARSSIAARADRKVATVATAQAAASDERERIARDMHDVVAHSLAVVIAQADGARYASATDPDAAPAALATISTTARAALADVRLLLTQLRHRQGEGPQPTLTDLDALYEQVRAAGVPLTVEVEPAAPGVPPAGVQLAVYRILQEALTNALRHGGGAPVAVRLAWHPSSVDVSVRNRIPVGAPAGTSGHGLIGMGERATLAGGTVTAAEQGDDFVVEASIPILAPR